MRRIILLAFAFFLVSCAALKKEDKKEPAPSSPVVSNDRPAAASVDVGVDWSWRVLGDASVRPVQVFTLRDKTYLQMREQKPVVLLVNGEIIPYRMSPPYLVLHGAPRQIDIVSDGYRAIAIYTGKAETGNGSYTDAAKPAERSRVQRVEMK